MSAPPWSAAARRRKRRRWPRSANVETLVKQFIGGGLEFGDRRLGLAPRADRDDRAALGQRQRNRLADAGKTAGDDRNPTVEVTAPCYHSPVVCIETQGSAGGSGFAFLQQLDRDIVRRAEKRHVAVARRHVDGNAGIHRFLANA